MLLIVLNLINNSAFVFRNIICGMAIKRHTQTVMMGVGDYIFKVFGDNGRL